LRVTVVLCAAIAVGACVAVAGAVGFVGLIAPVIARGWTRGHPGRALLPAALLGALLLTGADLLTRFAPLGRVIPLGVVTAAIGTPLFLWLLMNAVEAGGMTSLLDARDIAVPGRLAPLDLSVAAGERVAVIGPNGSGKTSLLRALAGITEPAADIGVGGERIADAAPARRRKLLAFLPASREVRWPIPVRDVIALGLERPDPARIAQLLEAFDLTALAERAVDTLSTGERARALLARALGPRPRLLLLDEPLSNLDPAWALRTFDLLADAAKQGSALLVSVHDLSLVRDFTRVLMLAEGRLVADGTPDAVLGSARFGEVFGVEPAGTGWKLRAPVSPGADPRSSR
jgi:iron complex transport system ATP-binding protein